MTFAPQQRARELSPRLESVCHGPRVRSQVAKDRVRAQGGDKSNHTVEGREDKGNDGWARRCRASTWDATGGIVFPTSKVQSRAKRRRERLRLLERRFQGRKLGKARRAGTEAYAGIGRAGLDLGSSVHAEVSADRRVPAAW